MHHKGNANHLGVPKIGSNMSQPVVALRLAGISPVGMYGRGVYPIGERAAGHRYAAASGPWIQTWWRPDSDGWGTVVVGPERETKHNRLVLHQTTEKIIPRGFKLLWKSTLRSVLRTQMKVQTDGLLLDLRTTNPPGPFSPLEKGREEKRREVQWRKERPWGKAPT